MIQLPVPELATPREEVIQILARGPCDLVMRGCKPDQPKTERHPVLAPQARRRNAGSRMAVIHKGQGGPRPSEKLCLDVLGGYMITGRDVMDDSGDRWK